MNLYYKTIFSASNKSRPLDSIVTKLDFDTALTDDQPDKPGNRRHSEQGSALLELDIKVCCFI